jgi:hypothetical protein
MNYHSKGSILHGEYPAQDYLIVSHRENPHRWCTRCPHWRSPHVRPICPHGGYTCVIQHNQGSKRYVRNALINKSDIRKYIQTGKRHLRTVQQHQRNMLIFLPSISCTQVCTTPRIVGTKQNPINSIHMDRAR